MKYSRDEIIKAVECCTATETECLSCPLKAECYDRPYAVPITEQALALAIIRELKYDNERLQKLCELRKKDNDDTCRLLLKAENDVYRLRATIRQMKAERGK